jgi:hypothetical protein
MFRHFILLGKKRKVHFLAKHALNYGASLFQSIKYSHFLRNNDYSGWFKPAIPKNLISPQVNFQIPKHN